MKILIKREGPLGAVLLTTPIAKYLRQLHGSEATIHLQSSCKAAYFNNKDIDGMRDRYETYDLEYDLNGAFEKRPTIHIIDAYIEEAELPILNKRVVFNYTRAPIAIQCDWSKTVVIHAAATFENRTLPRQDWINIVDKLKEAGYTIIQVGTGKDHSLPTDDKCFNLTYRGSLNDTIWLISKAKCFICSDGGLLHFAGATDTPIIALFTTNKYETRVPWRNGAYGYNCFPVFTKADCYGCLTKAEPPVLNLGCKLTENQNKCVTNFDLNAIPVIVKSAERYHAEGEAETT